MKKLLTTCVLVVTAAAGSFAQSAQIKIKARETDIPVNVVESFQKDFAGEKGTQWSIMPAKVVGDEYVVTGYDNLNGQIPNSYEVLIKGNRVRGRALYDRDGNLTYLKEVITNAALPTELIRAIAEQYPGYALVKDQETIKEGKTLLIHYKVTLKKGNKYKHLAIDIEGKIIEFPRGAE